MCHEVLELRSLNRAAAVFVQGPESKTDLDDHHQYNHQYDHHDQNLYHNHDHQDKFRGYQNHHLWCC